MTTTDKSRQTKTTVTKDATPRRPARVPLNRYRDILTVFGKDPNFYYRWVKDTDEKGSNILMHVQAGYSLVPSDEVTIGDDKVDKESAHGSIVRLQWKGESLYLMKQNMEFREEDVALHHEEVDLIDDGIRNPVIDPEDAYHTGQHGDVRFGVPD